MAPVLAASTVHAACCTASAVVLPNESHHLRAPPVAPRREDLKTTSVASAQLLTAALPLRAAMLGYANNLTATVLQPLAEYKARGGEIRMAAVASAAAATCSTIVEALLPIGNPSAGMLDIMISAWDGGWKCCGD